MPVTFWIQKFREFRKREFLRFGYKTFWAVFEISSIWLRAGPTRPKFLRPKISPGKRFQTLVLRESIRIWNSRYRVRLGWVLNFAFLNTYESTGGGVDGVGKLFLPGQLGGVGRLLPRDRDGDVISAWHRRRATRDSRRLAGNSHTSSWLFFKTDFGYLNHIIFLPFLRL